MGNLPWQEIPNGNGFSQDYPGIALALILTILILVSSTVIFSFLRRLLKKKNAWTLDNRSGVPPDEALRGSLIPPFIAWSVVGFLFFFLFLELFPETLPASLPGLPHEKELGLILAFTLISQGILTGSIFIVLRRRRINREKIGLDRWRLEYLRSGWFLFLLLLPVMFFIQVLVEKFAGEMPVQEIVLRLREPAGLGWSAFFLFSGGIVIPVFEEILFRGFLFGIMSFYVGTRKAMIYSAAIFAGLHGYAGVFPALFVMGIALAWIYRKTGSIWPSIITHSANNLVFMTLAMISARAGT